MGKSAERMKKMRIKKALQDPNHKKTESERIAGIQRNQCNNE